MDSTVNLKMIIGLRSNERLNAWLSVSNVSADLPDISKSTWSRYKYEKPSRNHVHKRTVEFNTIEQLGHDSEWCTREYFTVSFWIWFYESSISRARYSHSSSPLHQDKQQTPVTLSLTKCHPLRPWNNMFASWEWDEIPGCSLKYHVQR